MNTATRVPLSSALRDAARTLAREVPPADLEARVLASVAASARPAAPRAQRRGAWQGLLPGRLRWVWSASGLLVGLLTVSLLLSVSLPASRSPSLIPEAMASGFIPVAGAEAWRGASEGDMPAWLVHTEMPRERLGLLGLPYDPGRAGESVRAELLMHGSGTVLAVRVLAQ